MSNDPDGTSRTDDIDVIRQLLRKLEEVAARDGERSPPAGEPGVATPTRDLATLRQGTGSLTPPHATPLPELPTRTIEFELEPQAWSVAATVAEGPRRTSAFALALGSFLLGAGAAFGVVFALDPFKQMLAQKPHAVVVVAPPGAAVPAPVTAPATAAVAPEVAATAAPAEAPAVVREVAAAVVPEVADAPRLETPNAVAATGAAPTAAQTPDAEKPVPVALTPVPFVPVPVAPEPPPHRVADAAPVPPQPRAAEPGPSSPRKGAAAPSPAAQPESRTLDTPSRLELRAGVRHAFDLLIEPIPREAAALLLVFRNVPEWLTFSKGSAIGNEIWLLPAHLAKDLMAELAEGAEGTADIKVQLATADGRMLAEAVTSIWAARRLDRPASPGHLVTEVPLIGDQGVLRLMARAELLLDTGEVESARTLLRRAAESGSVGAALKLAETYDPSEVQRLGMTETSANPGEAVRWYEHAQSLGSVVATARLVALGRR